MNVYLLFSTPERIPFRIGAYSQSPCTVCMTQVKKRSCLPAVRAELPPLRAAEWLPLKLWLDRSIIIRLQCDQTVPIDLFVLSGYRSQMSEMSSLSVSWRRKERRSTCLSM